MPHKTLMFTVVARSEVGGFAKPIPPARPPSPVLFLKLRQHHGTEPIALEVDADLYEACPTGTEVEITIKPVRS